VNDARLSSLNYKNCNFGRQMTKLQYPLCRPQVCLQRAACLTCLICAIDDTTVMSNWRFLNHRRVLISGQWQYNSSLCQWSRHTTGRYPLSIWRLTATIWVVPHR